MEEQVLSLLIKELPILLIIVFVAYKIADYLGKQNSKHQEDLKDVRDEMSKANEEKELRHQQDLKELQVQMSEMNNKNLEFTMNMYERQEESNRSHYEKQEAIHKDNIDRLENLFKMESENNKEQMKNLKLVYDGQEKRLSEMKDDIDAYKREMDEKREEDRVLFSNLLKEEQKVFTDGINAFNGAITHFEETTTKIDKLEKEVNTKIDNLEDNVNSIKDIIIEKRGE